MERDDMAIRYWARAAHTTTLTIVLALASTAGGIGPPVLAQDRSPEPPPASTPERRDLYLDMPYYLGGSEPDIVITRGAEHLAHLDPDRAEDAETIADLEGLLEATGASIEDMTSGYALVSQDDLVAFVVAVRIDDADPGSLLPAYLPILVGGLVDPVMEAGTIGGKDILVITSEADNEERANLYVYDTGDTVWMIQGPDDVVEQTLATLPPTVLPD